MKSPPPEVLFLNLGESSLDFKLRVWILDADDILTVKSQLYHEIFKRFREKGIAIPFPQRDVHLYGAASQGIESPQKNPGKGLSPEGDSA
jgi:small-conductance mechanosensitive channel